MPGLPLHHDKEWLKEQYVNRRRSTTDIATECNVSNKAISKALHRHAIPTRPKGGTNTTGTNRRFRDLIDAHSPRPGDQFTPRSYKTEPVDPDGFLVCRVDLGWVSDVHRIVLAVHPHHTWLQLGAAILCGFDVEDADDIGHLWRFATRDDNKAASLDHWYGYEVRKMVGPMTWASHPYVENEMSWEMNWDDVKFVDPEGPVVETAFRGANWAYEFDFGSTFHTTLRFLDTCPPRAQTKYPELLAGPSYAFDLNSMSRVA